MDDARQQRATDIPWPGVIAIIAVAILTVGFLLSTVTFSGTAQSAGASLEVVQVPSESAVLVDSGCIVYSKTPTEC